MSLDLTDREKAALRAEFCKGFNDDQAEAFFTFCRVRGLLPGKHVLAQLRRSKEWDEMVGAKVEVTKIVFITTIDASRLIAQRTGQYGGQAPEQYIYLDENGAPSLVSEIPLPKLPIPVGQTALPREPWAVKTTVYRKDFDHPVSSVARFDAYASTYRSANGPVLTEMWTKRGPEQLAKCSEMLSLRRAFPEELGGLYIAEEFKADAEEAQPPAAVTPASVVPLPPSVPKVDQTPATGKAEPRPGETKTEFHATTVPATLPEHSGETLVVKPDAKAEALKAVPDLKPASDLSEPKKRGGRPAKKDPILPPIDEITQGDIDNLSQPAPVVDDAANRREAQEFVEAVTSFTEEQAKDAGLPPPPDPLPSKEESAAFVARARKLVEPGVDIKSVGDYTLKLGDKTGSKYLTVGDWTKALTNLEAAKAEGTLKELVKKTEVPLGDF